MQQERRENVGKRVSTLVPSILLQNRRPNTDRLKPELFVALPAEPLQFGLPKNSGAALL